MCGTSSATRLPTSFLFTCSQSMPSRSGREDGCESGICPFVAPRFDRSHHAGADRVPGKESNALVHETASGVAFDHRSQAEAPTRQTQRLLRDALRTII